MTNNLQAGVVSSNHTIWVIPDFAARRRRHVTVRAG
jgi:hypothetical protein